MTLWKIPYQPAPLITAIKSQLTLFTISFWNYRDIWLFFLFAPLSSLLNYAKILLLSFAHAHTKIFKNCSYFINYLVYLYFNCTRLCVLHCGKFLKRVKFDWKHCMYSDNYDRFFFNKSLYLHEYTGYFYKSQWAYYTVSTCLFSAATDNFVHFYIQDRSKCHSFSFDYLLAPYLSRLSNLCW